MHHIVYRSAGGADDLANVLTLCWRCHQKEHGHEFDITGTGAAVTIQERNLETGRLGRQWESVA
jgi:5-methylcytosine-specific restriction endonuclease McrA